MFYKTKDLQPHNGPKDKSKIYPIKVDSPVIEIATGENHYAVLTQDGRVYVWENLLVGDSHSPLDRYFLSPWLKEGIEGNVVELKAGFYHTIALTNRGEIWGWGQNTYNQLGKTKSNVIPNPIKIEGMEQEIKKISLGRYHSLALTSSGQVLSWGRNFDGQLGQNNNVIKENPPPLPIKNLPAQIVEIAAGGWHSLVMAADGSLWSFGNNGNGQLGYFLDNKMELPLIQGGPTKITKNLEGRRIIKIAAGYSSSFALIEDKKNSVFAWGNYLERSPVDNDFFSQPSSLPKIDPSLLLLLFGPGGRSPRISLLEKIQRTLIGEEFAL